MELINTDILKKFNDPGVEATFLMARNGNVQQAIQSGSEHLKFIWNHSDSPVTVKINEVKTQLLPDQILCCTYLHTLALLGQGNGLTLLGFNRAFYCIHTNDAEVSCNGLLFFGSDSAPVITLDEKEKDILYTLLDVLEEEFDTVDRNQEEMLRILLKRFIIRCTRLARRQLWKACQELVQVDLIRQFNILVEEHFREYKQVSDYARMLNRSPKTLTNIFGEQTSQSPLQVIHQRVLLEAKRLILYTDKSAKEITWELGFDDPSTFSRFFKSHTGKTVQDFRDRHLAYRFG